MSQAAFDIAWPIVGSSSAVGDLVAVAEARLDRARDPVHRPHRLDRVLADRRLAGEHHRRGAVEDRVRDVARLGARRLGRVDHRLEHLRRGDHRLAALERREDDPLLQQRHRRPAPISTPRSPRATITRVGLGEDLVERRRPPRPSRSSRSPGPCEPRASISVRSVATSAAERTKESATKSTPSASANSRSSRSFRVSDGIGSGTPGRLTPLCGATGPPTTTGQRARPRSTRLDAKADETVVDQHVVPGRRTYPMTDGRPGGRRRSRRPRRRSRRCHRPRASTRLGEVADAELRPLEVGDQGDRAARVLDLAARRPRRCARGRRVSRARDSAWRRPCPASISAATATSVDEAGPIVATIFVRRVWLVTWVGVDASAFRSPPWETRPTRDTAPRLRAPPRCGGAGCTSRRDRSAPSRPS